ncbi:MAG: hypothetical protein ACTSRG_04585 [Candidatus Helarchaeota archaeon]
MKEVFIDTELWSFALKKPLEKKPNLLKRYKQAKDFLMTRFKEDIIYISSHQLSEIFHVLSFRGNKLPIKFTINYIEKVMKLKNIKIINNNLIHFKKSMELSQESNIHIWDFLCVLPVIYQIEIIYTCDTHFKAEVFKNFKRSIQNPLDFWLSL